MRQSKIFIAKYRLGVREWFTVYIDGLECSTPIDTLPEAVQWVRAIVSREKVGVYRVSSNLMEVIICE